MHNIRYILPQYLAVLSDEVCLNMITALEVHGKLTQRGLMIKCRVDPEQRKKIAEPIAKLLDVGAISITHGVTDRRNRYHELNPDWQSHVEEMYALIQEYRK